MSIILLPPRKRRLALYLAFAFLTLLVYLYVGRRQTRRPQNGGRDEDYVYLRSNDRQSEYIDKKGMHVIVGKYVGDTIEKDAPTFTQTELNHNGYRPQEGAGEQGQPVFLRGQEERMAKRLWHINKFNLVVSDKIALNRSLQDVRKSTCKEISYARPLPMASVIIVFHNEAWSTLLRTVQSVLTRTKSTELREIILVDDASNRTFLRQPLEDFVTTLARPVHIVRSESRVGLIKARLLGAKMATGQVLIFLDAHCEVTQGWAEPLLSRIAEKRETVVCPVIDIINDDNFSYIKSFSLHWGAFNWELHFR